MLWRQIDRWTGADPQIDFDFAVKSRIAVAYTAIFTLMGLVNASVLTFILDGRPGMAELGLASAALAATVGFTGLRLRRPNLTILVMITLASIVLFAAAWANRGSFPPATLYLPGIVLGAYIAWGARAALFAVLPLTAYFSLILATAEYSSTGPLGFRPTELLNMLIATGALSCVWIVLFGSSFRSATTDAQAALTEANKQLETALISAQQANRAKSDFIANMSHEVRTPLNGVLGMTNVLQADESLSDEHRRSLDLIDDSGKALLELLNDILDLSKIEADALELETREFDLSALVRNTTDHWRPQAEAKGVALTVNNQLGEPAFVSGDPIRLRQVINNLLGNAVKFTHTGRISVSLATVGEVRDGKTRIRFAVRDTGIGIPGNKQDAIFDPFKQVDASVTRSYGGTGLGLAICRRLVAKMDGKITLSSKMGRGSTFTVDVPMERVVASEPDVAKRDPASIAPLAVAGRVLVVDDVMTNQLVLKAMVQQIIKADELIVDCASGGREAVNKATSLAYDVVLMDIQMPEMDGVSAMQCIRETRKSADARIIAVTALASDDHRREFLAAGFTDYLPKPVEIAELRRVLKTVMPPQSADADAQPDEARRAGS
ncbi:ATP-binding protein [Maricaulis maris]|uniref:histidine kinase n=1 Tax=Maricaulis maris TaxID=74318 RepID=A0A495DDD7_9PROT|nr:ATP-binding protein [Maricaulis maris]RKR00329.1 signal transduction histidine kinase [Maricaulis maris]